MRLHRRDIDALRGAAAVRSRVMQVRAYVMFLRRRAEGRRVEPNEMSDERIRLVSAQADHEQLKVLELQRGFLPRDGVLDAWEQLTAAFSEICLALPGKLAPRLAVIHDRGKVQKTLAAAVREAFTQCSEYELPDSPHEPPAGGNGKSRPTH